MFLINKINNLYVILKTVNRSRYHLFGKSRQSNLYRIQLIIDKFYYRVSFDKSNGQVK